MEKNTRTKRRPGKKKPPGGLPYRHLYYDRKDIALLKDHLQWEFAKAFSSGFTLSFGDGEDELTFTMHLRLTPASAERHLKGLGINPALIKMATESIEGQHKKRTPKPRQIHWDNWFKFLHQKFFGEKIKAIIAKTPESHAKWNNRLKQCGRSWKEISLSRRTVIYITRALLKKVIGDEVTTEEAIGKRLSRWEKREKPLIHGVAGKTFSFGWKISGNHS